MGSPALAAAAALVFLGSVAAGEESGTKRVHFVLSSRPDMCIHLLGKPRRAKRVQIWDCPLDPTLRTEFIIPKSGKGQIVLAQDRGFCLDAPKHTLVQLWFCNESSPAKRRHLEFEVKEAPKLWTWYPHFDLPDEADVESTPFTQLKSALDHADRKRYIAFSVYDGTVFYKDVKAVSLSDLHFMGGKSKANFYVRNPEGAFTIRKASRPDFCVGVPNNRMVKGPRLQVFPCSPDSGTPYIDGVLEEMRFFARQPVVDAVKFDCTGASEEWSPLHESFCCRTEGRGCPTTTSPPPERHRNCDTPVPLWSDELSDWCCKKKGKGCTDCDQSCYMHGHMQTCRGQIENMSKPQYDRSREEACLSAHVMVLEHCTRCNNCRLSEVCWDDEKLKAQDRLESGSAPKSAVQLSVKVSNLDYQSIKANYTMFMRVTSAVREAVATAAGPGIKKEQVTSVLSAGSVNVKSEIQSGDVPASSILSAMEDTAGVKREFTRRLGSVPGIESCATGSLQVSDVQVTAPSQGGSLVWLLCIIGAFCIFCACAGMVMALGQKGRRGNQRGELRRLPMQEEEPSDATADQASVWRFGRVFYSGKSSSSNGPVYSVELGSQGRGKPALLQNVPYNQDD